MFAWDPFVLLDVGFQLSVGAMVGIYAVHRYRSRFRPVPGGDYLLYSTGAFLGVAPLILFYFHYLPRWGVLFGWLGSLLFPLFLFGLCLQTLTMVAGWSALADLGETMLLWTETGVLRSFRGVDLLLTVSDVRVLTVLVLGACIWITVEGDRAVWAQAVAGVAVLVLLLAVALPPTRPHLEVALPNQRPVLFVHNPHGVRALVLSPGVHPGPGEVYSIKRYLRGKGVVELDVLVSSLTRRGLRRLRPGFVVDRLGVHGSGGGAVNWEGGGYDFDHHRLDSYFGSIRYNIQKFEREQPPGSRHTLYCPETGPCEVGRRPVQTAARGSGTRAAGTPLPIAEDPIRWVSPGRPRTGTRVTQTVEDHLRTFLPGY